MIDKKYCLLILESRMKEFATKLSNMPEIVIRGLKINSNAWINQDDFGIAYISCSRSPAEESIDLTLDISIGNAFSIEAGIYLSDGTLIQDFGSVSLQGKNSGEIISYLERYLDRLESNELVLFSKFLSNQERTVSTQQH